MANLDISLSHWCNQEFITIGQAFLAFWRNAAKSEEIDEIKLRFLVEIIDELKEDTLESINFVERKPIGLNRWALEFSPRQLFLMKTWPRCSRNSYTGANPVTENILIHGKSLRFPADIVLRRKPFDSLLIGDPTPANPTVDSRTGATMKGITACTNWLADLRRQSDIQPLKKREFEKEAKANFGVGPRQFQNAWATAAALVPNPGWGRAGAPKKNHDAKIVTRT